MGALIALVPALLPQLLSTVSKFIPDPKAQADAQAEIIKALSDQDAAINDAMSKVMTADAASESWMTRNARPTVVYWCLGMITLWFVASLFGFGPVLVTAFAGVPEQLWSLASYGIGAYIVGKSGVDIAKAVVTKK